MTSWSHGDTLQLAMTSQTNEKCIVNIYELKPTSTPPLHMLSSFSIPYHDGYFYFSPISFHISFVTPEEVIIYNTQDSKLLLQATTQGSTGQFSPDGQFFACRGLEGEIHIWQNTPTSYMLWRSLRSQLPFHHFSWSPTLSISCWGYKVIQLLDLDSNPSALPPNKIEPLPIHQGHLVAYSANWLHIATLRKHDNIIKVLDCHSGILHQSTDTNMEIWCIEFVGNTIFAIGGCGLFSWDLESGRTAYSTHGIKSNAINCSTLSHDCSQIAFTESNCVFLYDIKSQMVASRKFPGVVDSIKFSPDGYQLLVICGNHWCFFVELEELGIWESIEKGLPEGQSILGSPSSEEDKQLMFNSSSQGCHHNFATGWVLNSQGRKLMWLPVSWRTMQWENVRWDGNFLALLHEHHPEPIIIEFQPLPLPLIHI